MKLNWFNKIIKWHEVLSSSNFENLQIFLEKISFFWLFKNLNIWNWLNSRIFSRLQKVQKFWSFLTIQHFCLSGKYAICLGFGNWEFSNFRFKFTNTWKNSMHLRINEKTDLYGPPKICNANSHAARPIISIWRSNDRPISSAKSKIFFRSWYVMLGIIKSASIQK